ncbi:MAG: Xaa-Pro peptidase family protein [Clostridia bacterium]
MKERQNNLRQMMQKNQLDAVLLTNGVNIRYYTGFSSWECEVLITDKTCYLVTDFRYTIQAKAQAGSCAEIIEANGREKQLDVLRELLRANGCKCCGYEQECLTVKQFSEYRAFDLDWSAFGDEISSLRAIKSASEIESLQKAQCIADKAFAALIPKLKIGMSERQAEAELNYLCSVLGSEGPSFDPIVGAGENGAMCHAVPGERRFRNGDLVVFDFGCIVDGYHSDMTRTIGFGTIDAELLKIYEITLEAQQRCLDTLKAGMTGKALDAVARDCIESYGYGEHFGHGLGHGFGLEIHEPPRAAKTSVDTLVAGMTVTIEPGIYLEGKGGVRIEDCVVVTDAGCLNLVSTARDLLIV